MLLVDLVAAQHSYQQLLKQSLQEQKIHLQLLSQSFAASNIGVGAATRNNLAAGDDAVNMGEATASTSEGGSGNNVMFCVYILTFNLRIIFHLT